MAIRVTDVTTSTGTLAADLTDLHLAPPRLLPELPLSFRRACYIPTKPFFGKVCLELQQEQVYIGPTLKKKEGGS